DVLAELEEGPGMPFVAMFAANRCSLSDPTQVFESECLARYDGFLDELLADAVVGVALETGLTTAVAYQAPLGVLGSALLEALTPQVIAVADVVNHGPGEVLAFAISRKIHDAQVNAQGAAVRLG